MYSSNAIQNGYCYHMNIYLSFLWIESSQNSLFVCKINQLWHCWTNSQFEFIDLFIDLKVFAFGQLSSFVWMETRRKHLLLIRKQLLSLSVMKNSFVPISNKGQIIFGFTIASSLFLSNAWPESGEFFLYLNLVQLRCLADFWTPINATLLIVTLIHLPREEESPQGVETWF